MKPLYFVNYTELSIASRTTETKTFPTLKAALDFADGKRGYITKYAEPKCVLKRFFGGFVPSASEDFFIKTAFAK